MLCLIRPDQAWIIQVGLAVLTLILVGTPFWVFRTRR
jgi:cbb3-type cytochrome oxidase subunit 3